MFTLKSNVNFAKANQLLLNRNIGSNLLKSNFYFIHNQRISMNSTKAISSKQIAELNDKYILPLYAKPNDLIISHGKGVKLYDINKNEYLDLTAGISVNALGYGDKEIQSIIADQAGKIIHLSNLYHNEYSAPLGELLVKSLPSIDKNNGLGVANNNGTKAFFCNSGTEANEAALKFARKYGQHISGKINEKIEVISFNSSFHGRTFGSLSATPTEKYQKYYTPLVPGFKHLKYNDIEAFEKTISNKTCAVILEPIQGEGGIHPVEYEFIKKVRELCTKYQSLLIFDEVQCGLGRSGKLHCFTKISNNDPTIRPDILSIAKPIANGYPMGSVIVAPHVGELLHPGDHGTTFGGSPMACRIALNVISRIQKPEFLQNVDQVGTYFKTEMKNKLLGSVFTQVRGEGLILGLQCNAKYEANEIVKQMLAKEKILAVSAGGNTIRIVPPLIFTKANVDDTVSRLQRLVADL